MREKLPILILLFVIAGFIYMGREMIRPIPFLSTNEKNKYEQYRNTAKKLQNLNLVRLDITKFPTRRDFIIFLISKKVYTNEEILLLGTSECLNSNDLYDTGIIFWNYTQHAVFYVDDTWSSSITTRKDFKDRHKLHSDRRN